MNTPIRQLLQKRREILLIIATAVLLTLGISLVSTYLSVMLNHNHSLYLGIAFLLIGAIILTVLFLGGSSHIVRLNGAILYNEKDKKIRPVKIIGYRFNDDFCRYLHALLHENEAYWTPFSKKGQDIAHTNRFDPNDLNHYTIINSTIEYTVLYKLIYHLEGYFRENEIDSNSIVEITRNELDPSVLKNRVIDQLTKDMAERAAFGQDRDPETLRGVVVHSTTRDGAIFDKLEIELPQNSKITRNSNGYLVIKNPIFELTIIPKYAGLGTSLPFELIRPEEGDSLSPFAFSLKLHIRISNRAFLTDESMEIYSWLDSLVDTLQNYISIDKLQERLDVNLAELINSTTNMKSIKFKEPFDSISIVKVDDSTSGEQDAEENQQKDETK